MSWRAHRQLQRSPLRYVLQYRQAERRSAHTEPAGPPATHQRRSQRMAPASPGAVTRSGT
eukprot:scaffold8179_cov430-Prasinococcus_capsulatus_cf.AAC.2